MYIIFLPINVCVFFSLFIQKCSMIKLESERMCKAFYVEKKLMSCTHIHIDSLVHSFTHINIWKLVLWTQHELQPKWLPPYNRSHALLLVSMWMATQSAEMTDSCVVVCLYAYTCLFFNVQLDLCVRYWQIKYSKRYETKRKSNRWWLG